MDKEYDKVYRISNHDYVRTCASYRCGKTYKQWSGLQDNEAWSYCWVCADKITNPKQYKKRNK